MRRSSRDSGARSCSCASTIRSSPWAAGRAPSTCSCRSLSWRPAGSRSPGRPVEVRSPITAPGSSSSTPSCGCAGGCWPTSRGWREPVITLLRQLEIDGEWRRSSPGVWVGPAKICSFGVQVRHRVSVHGLALNVSTDLAAFRTIVPCGMPDVVLTSMAQLRHGTVPALPELAAELSGLLAQAFGLDLDPQPDLCPAVRGPTRTSASAR